MIWNWDIFTLGICSWALEEGALEPELRHPFPTLNKDKEKEDRVGGGERETERGREEEGSWTVLLPDPL